MITILIIRDHPYLILVTRTTGGACGEFFCPVEKFIHITDCHVEKFSTWWIVMWKKLSTWKIWRKSVMWRNYVYNLWRFIALNCCKIIFFGNLRCFVEIFFVKIYALLCAEKLSQKLCLWRKRTNIMYVIIIIDHHHHHHHHHHITVISRGSPPDQSTDGH